MIHGAVTHSLDQMRWILQVAPQHQIEQVHKEFIKWEPHSRVLHTAHTARRKAVLVNTVGFYSESILRQQLV